MRTKIKDLKGKELESGLLSTEEADGVSLPDPHKRSGASGATKVHLLSSAAV